MYTNNINANTHPALFNLLNVIYVTDTIIVEDLDSDTEINITELIEEARRELGI